MKPYYADEANKIALYHGDVQNVTQVLQAYEVLPEKTITVTDPPYNVGMDYGPEVDDKREVGEYMNWCNDWFQLVPRPLVLTPGFVNFEMWTAWIEWPTGIVPWVKPNQSKKPFAAWQWFNVWEPVLFYGKTPNNPKQDVIITAIGQQADVKRRRPSGILENRHPCPKFLPFWLKLIGNVWKPGWTIYDPFVGSGTTALACKRLGIPFVGSDIKAEYLDLSIERLQQEVIPLPDVEVDDTFNFKLSQQAIAWDQAANGVVHDEVEVGA
jgi:DNA modification methylase